MNEKEFFCKNVTLLTDTREQKNSHILTMLDRYGIQHRRQKLTFADYSFVIGGRTFETEICVERKANPEELWGNLTRDRARFEREISGLYTTTKQPILLLENIPDRSTLKSYHISDEKMQRQGRKVSEIGAVIDSTLQSWAAANRYNLRTVYAKTDDVSGSFA